MDIWEPITQTKLQNLILNSEMIMEDSIFNLWKLVKVNPTKWELKPWGDLGEGFWVVGLIGNQVLWYNDIDNGFNTSPYMTIGKIDKYKRSKDELHQALNSIFNFLQLETYELG